MTQPSLRGVEFTGAGMAVPELCLTNDQLAQFVDTSDDWIYSRTGIRERRILTAEQSVLDLAQAAGEQALAQAGLTAEQLDLVILTTSTPDDLFGSASKLALRLGATRAVAFDLTAACTGFIFAVVTAAQYLQTGVYNKALVVAADALSRRTDWQDRNTCVLFGDGAGAMVLEQAQTNALLGFELRSDGRGAQMLTITAATQALVLTEDITVSSQHYQPITMNGREVYRFVVTGVPEVIEKALHIAGIAPHQVAYYFLHQANQRILDAVAQRLNLPSERFPSTLARYANTSAASIPISLREWLDQGLVKTGDTLVFSGFGAGFTWGALVCRWGRQ